MDGFTCFTQDNTEDRIEMMELQNCCRKLGLLLHRIVVSLTFDDGHKAILEEF